MQVLEVTTAAIFLVGAVLFVQSMDPAPEERDVAQADDRRMARDLLAIMAYQDAPDNASDNLLAHEVAHALHGDQVLERHVDRYFPQQDWSVTLTTEGGGKAPVEDSGEALGEVTTARHPLIPGWTYAWETTRMGLYSGEHPMQVVSVPAHDSRSARLDGEPVQATVTVEENGVEKSYRVYESVGRSSGEEDTLTVIGRKRSAADGVGLTSSYIAGCDDLGLQDASELRCKFVLRFHGTGSTSLGPGTELGLDIPRGWVYEGFIGPSQVWSIREPTEGTEGPTTLLAKVNAGHSVTDDDEIQFTLNVTTDPRAPFSTFEARLANGTLSRGEIVVPHPGAEAKAPRAVYTSLPYPGVAGGTERWGVGFSNGLSEVTVTEVTLESVAGADLFASASVVENLDRNCEVEPDSPCPTVAVSDDGSRITWSGSEDVLQGETRDLILDVGASGTTTEVSSDDERTYPTVTFADGYAHDLTRQVGGPGVYTARIPPEADDLDLGGGAGYPTGEGTHEAEVTFWPRGELWKVESNLTYRVEDDVGLDELALDTQGAVADSTVNVTPLRANPGDVVQARVNASNVLTTASDQGADGVTMTTRLYAPPSLGETPVHTMTTNLSAEGVGQAATAVLAADVTGDGDEDAVLGARDHQVHAYAVDDATLAHSPLWSQGVGARPTALAAGAGDPTGSARTYVGAADGTVTALDPAGARTWTHEAGAYPVSALHPVDADDDGLTDVLWTALEAQDAVGADGGLRWVQIHLDHRETGTDVESRVEGQAGGASAATASPGPRLVTAVADPDRSEGTWVNATTFVGDTAWTQALDRRAGVVADAAPVDADGDGTLDVAVALSQEAGPGAVVLLDGADGTVLGSVEAREPAALAPAGDLLGGPGDEVGVATDDNVIGLVTADDGDVRWVWSRPIERDPWVSTGTDLPANREVERTCEARQHAVRWACLLANTGPGGPGSGVLAADHRETTLPVFEDGARPDVVGLDIVDPAAPAEPPRLAVSYSYGLRSADGEAGAVALRDAATGVSEGRTLVTPEAGSPLVAEGDGLPWVAAGTDRGHLALAGEGSATARHSQAADDRTRFRFPVAVGHGALYGTYVLDVTFAWSPAIADEEQSVHVATRFAVDPVEGVHREGFVYDTRLNVGTPTLR